MTKLIPLKVEGLSKRNGQGHGKRPTPPDSNKEGYLEAKEAWLANKEAGQRCQESDEEAI